MPGLAPRSTRSSATGSRPCSSRWTAGSSRSPASAIRCARTRRAALARVRALGWRLGILSGDHARVVAAVGAALGLGPGECRGGVSPEDKLRAVAAGLTEGPVVMVGDGVNDAAALAAATVGIAVHGGAEAALAAADVFVTRPGVARIAELLDGARRDDARGAAQPRLLARLQRDRRVPGHGGVLNPLVAAILMPLSSLTVIISSYRARTFRPPAHGEAPS